MEEKQYIVFRLNNEEFGIDIGSVQEIIQPPKITLLPCSPRHVVGIINLRGVIIPVIDLKKLLGLEECEESKEARVIVITVESRSYGIMVDYVHEVMHLANTQIDKGDEVYHNIDSTYISGIARLEDRLIILLKFSGNI